MFDLSADDKARLVRNKAGPDDYQELDYELVQPIPAGKRRAGAHGGAGAGPGSKLSGAGETRSVQRDTQPTFDGKFAATAKTSQSQMVT